MKYRRKQITEMEGIEMTKRLEQWERPLYSEDEVKAFEEAHPGEHMRMGRFPDRDTILLIYVTEQVKAALVSAPSCVRFVVDEVTDYGRLTRVSAIAEIGGVELGVSGLVPSMLLPRGLIEAPLTKYGLEELSQGISKLMLEYLTREPA